MLDDGLTLEEALNILEISDLENTNQDSLTKIRRRAMRRWHPDTIAFTNPSEATLERYESNFRLVDEAVDVINGYLRGEAHVGNRISEGHTAQPAEEPEEVIRRNAPELQETLRRVWERVKETGYKMHEDVITIRQGVRYKELLMDDLKENMPVLSVSSFFNGIFVYLIVGLILGVINQTWSSLLLLVVTILWAIQALSCVIGFLPLSRFWLPEKYGDVVFRFIDYGLSVNRFVHENQFDENLIVGLIIGLPIRLAQIFKWVVLFPIYTLIGAFLGERSMGTVKQTIKYYAGVADWYIEELIGGNPNDFSREQLFDLSYVNRELRDN